MNSDQHIPFVSVVIPAKNEETNIAQVLTSVQNQDYPSKRIEIFVVDNLSTDSTVEIADSFANVSVLSSDGNISEMRNLGVQQATGDIFAFIDADCIAPINWLSQSVDDLSDNENAAIVSAIMKLEDNVDVPWIEKYWVNQLRSKYKPAINSIDTISSFCFCIRREDFLAVGGFDSSLITCEDADLGFRIKNTGKSILADTRIETIHQGNAKSLWKFFLRQLWQGGSNLQNTKNRKLEKSELASLAAPAVFLGLLLGAIVFAVMLKTTLALVFVFAAIVIPALITWKKNTCHSLVDFFAYTLIWSTYLLARGLGYVVKIGRTDR